MFIKRGHSTFLWYSINQVETNKAEKLNVPFLSVFCTKPSHMALGVAAIGTAVSAPMRRALNSMVVR